MKKQTHEHMRAIGRAGGKKTAERAGHMASIAVKGGASTRAKYGPEYYAELGRKSAAARAARAVTAASPEETGTIATPGVETRAELITTPAAHTRAEAAASPEVIARAVEQTSPTVIARAETEAKPEATTRAESTAPTVA